MQNIQLQLNKKVSALSVEHPLEFAVLRGLCITAAVIVFLYLYLVSMSVFNVIAQREANQASAALESRIGVLEGQYFSLSEKITLEHATNLGLMQISANSFVYRPGTVGVASVAQNAI